MDENFKMDKNVLRRLRNNPESMRMLIDDMIMSTSPGYGDTPWYQGETPKRLNMEEHGKLRDVIAKLLENRVGRRADDFKRESGDGGILYRRNREHKKAD